MAKKKSIAKTARGKRKTARKKRPQKKAPRDRQAVPPAAGTAVLTTSFRLSPELLAELRVRATLRRNRGADPYTQSAIVETALREWLANNR
jgi:hypothetical protein